MIGRFSSLPLRVSSFEWAILNLSSSSSLGSVISTHLQHGGIQQSDAMPNRVQVLLGGITTTPVAPRVTIIVDVVVA